MAVLHSHSEAPRSAAGALSLGRLHLTPARAAAAGRQEVGHPRRPCSSSPCRRTSWVPDHPKPYLYRTDVARLPRLAPSAAIEELAIQGIGDEGGIEAVGSTARPVAEPRTPLPRIGVVGCGTVGLSYLSWLRERGFDVRGYDSNPSVRRRVRAQSGPEVVASALEELAHCDAIEICVPTDPQPDGAADVSLVQTVVEDIAKLYRHSPNIRCKFVSQRSTCPPGTADILAARLPQAIAYGVHPSFLRKGTVEADTRAPERIAYAGPDAYTDYLRLLYKGVAGPRFESRSRTAVELLKYIENALDAVLLSFWNEMLLLGGDLGLAAPEFQEILARLPDRVKFASSVRAPGKAFGLWCLPKDLAAILHEFIARDLPAGTLAGALETNRFASELLGVGEESSTVLISHDDRYRSLLTPEGRAQLENAFELVRAQRNDTPPDRRGP